MAVVQQAATIDPEYILLDGGGEGLLPTAQCVHRGALTLAATTGTDTKNIRVSFALPTNVVWQLKTFQFRIDTTSDYGKGKFELYYAPSSIAFGDSTQLDFPLSRADAFGGISGEVNNTYLLMAMDAALATQGEWAFPLDGPQGPFDLVSFQDESGGANPTVAIYSTAAPTDAGTARFALTWLGYTYEQMQKSALWTGLHNRS